jgi:hypothetical protein
MNRRFGLAVVLVAAAAFVVSECQAFARHGRRARCGSCCAAPSCGPNGCSMPAAPAAETSPSDASAPVQPPAPPAPDQGAAVTPSETPQGAPSVRSQPSSDNYYVSRRARRRWSRR